MRMGDQRGWWAYWLLLAWAVTGVLQAATFTASLDRSTISVGETATLALTIEGGSPQALPAFQPPPNLTIQSAGQSRQISMVNGQTTSSLIFNYQIAASKAGDYLIPAIQMQVDNQTLSSQPIRLKVTKSSGPTSLAFLRLIPAKETVYVGEVFPLEIQLYLGANQDSIQLPQLEGDGFIFGKVPQQPSQGNTQLGNQMYHVFNFRLSAVAVKTGPLTLGPAQCSLVLHVPAPNRGRSFFDDILGGGVQRKPVTLTSDPQTITVLPLPKENRPSDFNGAVGNFSILASASPTNVTAGDPITLRLQIAGQGNLESLPFPAGTDWPNFKLYPPTSKIEAPDALGLSGVKNFERVVIPENPDTKELPPIRFSFFDPEAKAYRTLATPALPLEVRASTTGQPQPTVLANSKGTDDAEPPSRDIVHIKPYFGTALAPGSPLVMRPWFWSMQALPLAAFLSALIWRKRRERLESNPRLRRRLTASEAVRQSLKSLSQHAQARDTDAFFATVFRVLQEQLGAQLDLPASAITEAVIDERIRGHAPDALVAQLHQLFQSCNQARYARQRSTQELMDLVPMVESTIEQLRKLPAESKA